MPTTPSIAALRKHTSTGYKGVYVWRDNYRAVANNAAGLQVGLGTKFLTPEDAARAVATYYLQEFGIGWEVLVTARRKGQWRVRRINTGLMQAWAAEIKLRENGEWHRVTASDVDSVTMLTFWSVARSGWTTKSAAIVAVRIYKLSHSTLPSPVAAP